MGKKTKSGKSHHHSSIGGFFIMLCLVTAGLFGGYLYYLGGRFMGWNKFNLLVIQDNPVVISVDKTAQTASVVLLPGDLYVTAAGDYGRYRLKSVFPLAKIDKLGPETLMTTVGVMLGVGIDGYIYSPDSPPLSKENFRDVLTNFTRFSKKPLTNLRPLDFIEYAKALISLRADKIKYFDLFKSDAVAEIVLEDGSKALEADLSRLDYYLSDWFLENDLRSEKYRVEILNSGSESGIGSAVARIFTSLGIGVVAVGDSQAEVEGCQIAASEAVLKSRTVRRINHFMGCKTKIGSSDRSDITLILRTLHPRAGQSL